MEKGITIKEKNKKLLKNIFASLFLIAFSGWVLAHLVLLYIYHSLLLQEALRWILWGEVFGVLAIIILGFERLIQHIRGKE